MKVNKIIKGFFFISVSLSCVGASVATANNSNVRSGWIVSHTVKLQGVKNQQELALSGFQNIMTCNIKIKELLNTALKAAPNGNFWYQKTEKDFYNFLVKWMYFLPRPDNALSMALKFQDLTKIEQAKPFLNNDMIQYWMSQFLNAKGDYLNSPSSTKNIPLFFKSKKINMADFIIPDSGFKSYNEFFVRSLKPGARPIDGYDDNQIVVSPNDGSIKLLEKHLKLSKDIIAKGDDLKFNAIFSGVTINLADKFNGGPLLYTQLGPLDYHHFHAPVGGKVLFVRKYYGDYDAPENVAAVTKNSKLVQNAYQHRRAVIIIYNKQIGLVGYVPLGYWMVGSIQLNIKSGDIIKKGQDIGNFAYGGSGILIFFQPNRIKINKVYSDEKKHKCKIGEEIAVAQSNSRNIVQ